MVKKSTAKRCKSCANREQMLRRPGNGYDILTRLFSKGVEDDETGCWLWIPSIDTDTYGALTVTIGGRKILKSTHVWCYEEFIGLVPKGMVLDHLCERKSCFFWGHLEPVTQAENARRALKGTSRPVIWNRKRGFYAVAV
jgi:hypothetical protein